MRMSYFIMEWMMIGYIFIDVKKWAYPIWYAHFPLRFQFGYQKIRAEMVSVLTQRKAMKNYCLSTSFQMSYDSGIQNMLDNLKIDLMKMGYADYIELRAYPADGCVHRRSTIFEGVCSVIVVYDYHDMPKFAFMTNEQRDKDILSKHPELAEVLSRMQKN